MKVVFAFLLNFFICTMIFLLCVFVLIPIVMAFIKVKRKKKYSTTKEDNKSEQELRYQKSVILKELLQDTAGFEKPEPYKKAILTSKELDYLIRLVTESNDINTEMVDDEL